MYKFTDTIIMTVAEWVSIQDNPIQRDTEKHARLAEGRHLKKADPAHWQVNMISLPDGERYKADAHTRAFLWNEGKILPPSGYVAVHAHEGDDIEDVKALYRTFDNPGAVDTPGDNLISAYKSNGMRVTSELFTIGPVTSALRGLDSLYGSKFNSGFITLPELVVNWKTEILLCDDVLFRRSKCFTTETLMAMLITVRVRGVAALKFWALYNGGEGVKDGRKRDGVEALTNARKEVTSSNKVYTETKVDKKGSTTHRVKYIGLVEIALSCFEAWRRKEFYESGAAKRTDILAYLGLRVPK